LADKKAGEKYGLSGTYISCFQCFVVPFLGRSWGLVTPMTII
jgi:hypothetical protein